MEETQVQTEEKLENGWLVWTVRERIDLKTSDEVGRKGMDLVNSHEKVVLDMSGVEYMSSAGLRVLLRLNKQAKNSGHIFTAVGAQGMVRTVLEDSGMDVLLQIKASLADFFLAVHEGIYED